MATIFDEELKWINTQFVQQYTQNPDAAYMNILEHAAALISRTNRTKILLKSDSTPFDISFIVRQLPGTIQQIKAGHGVTIPNFLPLPIPINDEKPVIPEEDLRKRSDKFYQLLKESLRDNLTVLDELRIPDGDISTLTICLENLHNDLSKLDARKTNQYFLLGKVLLAMKNKTKRL